MRANSLQSCLTLWCQGLYRLLCLWDSPGKNTGVSCHVVLQGIFPTQGSNPGLLLLPALAGGFFTASATWEAWRTGVPRPPLKAGPRPWCRWSPLPPPPPAWQPVLRVPTFEGQREACLSAVICSQWGEKWINRGHLGGSFLIFTQRCIRKINYLSSRITFLHQLAL